jgi:hypothetical protein
MVAYINDTAWIPNKFNAQITVLVALGRGFSKKISIYGASGNKQINLYAVQATAANTKGFPLNTHEFDSSFNLGVGPPSSMTFYSTGFTATVAGASVEPSLLITAIDSVHQTISGTFSFPVYTVEKNYTLNNITGQPVISGAPYATVTSGKFTSIPYTFSVDTLEND